MEEGLGGAEKIKVLRSKSQCTESPCPISEGGLTAGGNKKRDTVNPFNKLSFSL